MENLAGMVSEKRYFRDDYALGLVDSASEEAEAIDVGDDDGANFGIRVYIDGVEITAGSPVAIVTIAKGVTAHVTASNTWNLASNYALSSSVIRVDLYSKLSADADWTYINVWSTEALADTQLDSAIWTVSYHVERTRVTLFNYLFAFLRGESNSWIDNFTHSTPGAEVLVTYVQKQARGIATV